MSTDAHTGESVHPTKARKPWHRTKVIVVIVVAVAAVVALISSLTPWPSAMVIRAVFTKGGDETAAEMDKHVPDTALDVQQGIAYGDAGTDTTMDVFRPADADGPLPTVVWIHGGAWISGEKENVDPYLRILAAEGYTTVGVNYTIGPEGVYPLAVRQLDQALAYIDEHAAELGIDPDQIVLAGDSAGSQLASQMAALITNPDYAEIVGIDPSLKADQLAATILNCGVYDLAALAELDGIAGWGLKTAMWAYSGTKTWAEDSTGSTMSTLDWVTADFPATYISGGNGDGLTWLQSIPMAKRLESLGVEVTTLFWPMDHEPALPHEYQFHLDLPDARTALDETIAFLEKHTTR